MADQGRIKGNLPVFQYLPVRIQPQAADTDIVFTGRQDRYFSVSAGTQVIHHLITFPVIIHRYAGTGKFFILPDPDGGDHVGNGDLLQLFLRMNKISAEEDNTPEPFFLDDLNGCIHLAGLFLHPLDDAGILFLSCFFFQNTDHVVEEHIVHALDQHRDCLGVGTLQIAGAVVGYIIIF